MSTQSRGIWTNRSRGGYFRVKQRFFSDAHDTSRHQTLGMKDGAESYLPPSDLASAVASSLGKLSVENQTHLNPPVVAKNTEVQPLAAVDVRASTQTFFPVHVAPHGTKPWHCPTAHGITFFRILFMRHPVQYSSRYRWWLCLPTESGEGVYVCGREKCVTWIGGSCAAQLLIDLPDRPKVAELLGQIARKCSKAKVSKLFLQLSRCTPGMGAKSCKKSLENFLSATFAPLLLRSDRKFANSLRAESRRRKLRGGIFSQPMPA